MERPGPYQLYVLVAALCIGWMSVQFASSPREAPAAGTYPKTASVRGAPGAEQSLAPLVEQISARQPGETTPVAKPRLAQPPLGRLTEPERDDEQRATLEILVLDPGSRPAREAWVEVIHCAGDQATERILLRRTGPDGRLRMRLAPGAVRLVARDDTGIGGPEQLELAAGERTPVEMRLSAGREVAGRVLDAQTGAPLVGAVVSFWTFSETDRVLTAADGTFRHPRFPGNAVAQQVRIEASGYGSAVRYLKIRADGTWKLCAATAGSPSPSGTGSPWLEVALGRELRILGTIVDPESQPLAAASISAEGFFHVLPSVASRDGADTRSAATGEFVLTGLRADIGHSVIVRAPGFAEHVVEVAGAAEGELDVGQIRLEREALLVGVVVDADGQPVVDIEVLLTPRDDPGGTQQPTRTDTASPDVAVRVAGFEQRVRTGIDGTFLFDHLRELPYQLRVLRDNEALISLDLEPVAGQGFPALELDLPFQAFTMTGSVSGPDGPLANARVELERFGSVAVATTDRKGHFRIAGLDDVEAYDIRVSARCPRTGARLAGKLEAWAFESPRLVLSAR